MFLESFKTSILAVLEILILAGIGFTLVKKNILTEQGLDFLSRLVVELSMPLLIFSQLMRDFSFYLYPDWWLFPLLSIAVTLAGFGIGSLFSKFIAGQENKVQFSSLITFQNSGYLPLALIATLLPRVEADQMLVYLFLFLLGFNLVVWSFGVYMLSFTKVKKFELGSLFSPVVIAIIFSLVFIFFGLNRITPEFILRPFKMIGDCTLPLAMFVVGGNLAQMKFERTQGRTIFFIILAKLIVLPALGLLLMVKFNLPKLIGLLILMQLAVPPATSLSLIVRHYKKDDLIISQGVFFGHIASIITLPLFLSLYFTLVMIR